MRCVAGKDDNAARWIRVQCVAVELRPESNIEHARYHRVDAVFGVLMWHEFGAVRRFDADDVRTGLGRMTDEDREENSRWKGLERMPADVVRQDRFETVLTRLVLR